jgi:hypothetical protein
MSFSRAERAGRPSATTTSRRVCWWRRSWGAILNPSSAAAAGRSTYLLRRPIAAGRPSWLLPSVRQTPVPTGPEPAAQRGAEGRSAFRARPPAGLAGPGVGGLRGREEGRFVDLLQVAAGRAHAAPAAGNRRQGGRRHFAERLLLERIEHEVHVAAVACQRGKDPPRRSEGHPIEVGGLADVVEAQEQLARACRRKSHPGRLHPGALRAIRKTLQRSASAADDVRR